MNIKTLTLAAVTAVFSLSACGSTTKEAANSSNTMNINNSGVLSF